MHGTTRRTWAAGLAGVALVAGLTGCSGDGDGRAAAAARSSAPAVAKACTDGTFTWSAVKKTEKLTGVSGVQSLGKGGGTLSGPLERVYTPRASVKASGPAVSPAEVLFSLGKKIGEIQSDARTLAEADGGETWSFTDVNVKPPSLDGGRITVKDAGENVEYAGVREVAGDFSYTCPGGTTTKGRARTWQVDMAGVLDCQEGVDDGGMALQAARHSCEPGSPATRNA
ncbi:MULTISPECIES: hypothetical protein [unclassified Streptomyces]|uniref:hypothetical protein n=1 Tax=unclassified Streptomyces TaxID=2593676 RepID=UPI002259478E|nr:MULTISPECIES: hypothetical protein [unclassified Streptomyces]MCX5050801.1 hypothetical protein [Streptomyces sp. NBC_00474]MCX5061176.1 hypothetical protein [Streptomyces sp. NBC_00452]